MKLYPLALILLTLTGCSAFQKKDSVPPGVVIRTETVEVIKKEYVPINADLTKRCAWVENVRPSASLTELVIRKGCLKQYERQLGEIERITGKPAK